MSDYVSYREPKCIEVEEVIESALDEREFTNIVVPYTNLTPTTLIAPFTFTGCSSTGEAPSITNLKVEKSGFHNDKLHITMDVNIPSLITLTDVTGVSGTADAVISVHEDFFMFTPEDGIFPYNIQATASVRCPSGSFGVDGVLTVSICSVIVIKMSVKVLIDICTQGYHCPPPIDSNLGCNRFFSQPFYPGIEKPDEDGTP